MKKITTACMIFIILTFIIYVSGCSGMSSMSLAKQGDVAHEEDTKTREPYIGGTEGLVIRFYELIDQIPKSVVFPILLNVENKGEYTVPANELEVILLSSDLWNKEGSNVLHNSEELKGKSIQQGETTQGDIVVLGFHDCEYSGVQEKAIPPDSIRVQYCYPYKTYVTSDFCVLSSDAYTAALSGTSVYCSPTGTRTIFNSGAPIQVTKVEQFYSSPGSIIIGITIKKMSSVGTIYNNSAGGCTGDVNIVEIEDIYTSDPGVTYDCSGVNHIYLLDGEGQILCNLNNVDISTSYIEKIDFVFNYMYRNVITEKVQVFN